MNEETPGWELRKSVVLENAEMPRTTIALAIPWCPWIPERVESMARLRKALGAIELEDENGDGDLVTVGYHLGTELVLYEEFTDKAPNDEWSEQVFEWLASTGADWCMQIQEDAVVPENVWPIVRAILEAVPDECDVVGLHVCHPIAERLCLEYGDEVRFFTTADALVGVCWAVRGKAMREFVEWRRTQLNDGWRTPIAPKGLPSLTEDTMMGVWCMATGRRIYHPIPAPVDHDTSMASVWGNDDHQNRRPRVSWKDGRRFGNIWNHEKDPTLLEGAGYWMGRCRLLEAYNADGSTSGWRRAHTLDPCILTGRTHIPHVGRFYEATPGLAFRWVKGFTYGDYVKARQDNGDPEKRRLGYHQRAHARHTSKERILIATPTRGSVDQRYYQSMRQLQRIVDHELVDGFELIGEEMATENLVVLRSRFVQLARETDCTAIYWRDADVIAEPIGFFRMLETGLPFVGTPYPRRDAPDRYSVLTLPHGPDFSNAEVLLEAIRTGKGCVPVAGIPLGCAITRRECFEAMTEHYAGLDEARVDLTEAIEVLKDPFNHLSETIDIGAALVAELQCWRAGHMGLQFLDAHDGLLHRSVALFQLMHRDGRLFSEDNSFAMRWRDMGGAVHLYLGPGSPADHVSTTVFKGDLRAFGLSRGQPGAPRVNGTPHADQSSSTESVSP